MKRLLLFTVSFICFFIFTAKINAQYIQVTDTLGTVISNGTTIDIHCDTDYYFTQTNHYYVKNIGSTTATVKCRKMHTNLLTGAQAMFCFGGACYSASTMLSPLNADIPAGGSDDSFSAEYKPKGLMGQSWITYSFFNISTLDSAWIVLHYIHDGTGINVVDKSSVEISNPYPNPATANTSFNYTFPKNTVKAQFILRDLVGSEVKNININNQSGKLVVNTTDIKSGIYFYSFYLNDKLINTKKLVVQ